MSTNELERKIAELQELEAIAEEAKAEAESIKDEIKALMLEQDTEELDTGKHIIRWTSVLSNRFDSTAFKKNYEALYKKYTKSVQSKRFSIA